MNTRMQIVLVTAIGGPEVLQSATVQRPEPAAGEALIRVRYAPVAFNDFMERTDYFHHEGDPVRETPFVLGTEGIGIVESALPSSPVAAGTRVGFVLHGARTYAEYTTIPADRLIPLPDDISDEAAGALLAPGMTAHILLHEYRSVTPGMPVLITGATGGIGALLTAWAARLGAEVIATVRSEDARAKVLSYGASHAINVSTQDLVSEVKSITKGRGVSLALDAVGGPGFQQVFEALGARGVVVPYGIAGGKYPPLDLLALVDRSRVVAGLLYFDFVRTREELLARAEAVFDAARRGWIEPQIAGVFPLADAAQAHRQLESKGRGGKVLLQC